MEQKVFSSNFTNCSSIHDTVVLDKMENRLFGSTFYPSDSFFISLSFLPFRQTRSNVEHILQTICSQLEKENVRHFKKFDRP